MIMCLYLGLTLKVRFTLLILFVMADGITSFYLESQLMKPCPDVLPDTTVHMEKLLGVWHLSLLVLDSNYEDFVETDVCVTGELSRYNGTFVRQLWTVESSDLFNEPSAVIEFPTTVIRPGVLAVHTPLGGHLKATIFDAHPKSHMLVSHCGLHHGSMVHLWTAALTRSRELSPYLRLKLTASLINNGFDPVASKVITWQKC